MLRYLWFFLLIGPSLIAQQTLHVEKGVIFQLTGQNFSLDSLIMSDSAQLLLDDHYRNTLIRSDYVSIGKGCAIIGTGKFGEAGLAGVNSNSRAYSDGHPGKSGFAGVSLTFNFKDIVMADDLTINLTGGRGGDGGIAGSLSQQNVSVPSPPITTSSRNSANTPSSYNNNSSSQSFGTPGAGGSGGPGGNVTISFPAEYLRMVKDHFKIINPGGDGGEPATMNIPLQGDVRGGAGPKGRKGKVSLIPLRR